MAVDGVDGRRRRGLLPLGDEGVGAGKPLTVVGLLADDTTTDAVETDLLRYGVDLLDLYQGTLSLRRVCALVANLPDDVAVRRTAGPDAGRPRHGLLLAVLERRVTLLWATVAQALGHTVTDDDLTSPLDPPSTSDTSAPAAAGGWG